MTEKGFLELVTYLEGHYLIEFSDGTKEAWWTSLSKCEDDLGMRAAREMADNPDLFKPHLGKLKEIYDRRLEFREARKRQEMALDMVKTVAGDMARTLGESLQDKKWQPLTQKEREGAWFFQQLVHRAMEAHERLPGLQYPATVLTILQDFGGFRGLKALRAHDILMAREQFSRKYAMAVTVK